ncbi:MAG: methyltransferase domain-containing protein [Methylococcales bacterium]|nr:methyltransferase domain-containing protein [Methylococcales bacterium]MCK5924262.1 methyltransferase domain-containing protein [Methylococcales bacterium]
MTKLIDPQTLIDKYSLKEHAEFANKYFEGREEHAYLYQKPFHNASETGALLTSLGHLFNGIKLQSGMKVLDFAAGSCWLSKILVEFGCIVTSYDVSEKALAIGEQLFKRHPPVNRTSPTPIFNVFNGQSFDEEAHSFDRIIVNDAFHHIPNTQEVLNEFYRLLKPTGIVGMSEPGRYHSQTKASQFEMREYHVIENDFILENIWGEAQSVGFDRIQITPVLEHTQLSMNEYLALMSGEVSDSVKIAVQQNTENHSLFFLHKDIKVTEQNFNEEKYLSENIDVALAIKQGTIASGFQHYQDHGQQEGRAVYLIASG